MLTYVRILACNTTHVFYYIIKLFGTRTLTYATPTFITEALRLVTQVQLL